MFTLWSKINKNNSFKTTKDNSLTNVGLFEDSFNISTQLEEENENLYILNPLVNFDPSAFKHYVLEDFLVRTGIDFDIINKYLLSTLPNYKILKNNSPLFREQHFIRNSDDFDMRSFLQLSLNQFNFVFVLEIEECYIFSSNNQINLSFVTKKQPKLFLEYFPHLKDFFLVPQISVYNIGSCNYSGSNYLNINFLPIKPLGL